MDGRFVLGVETSGQVPSVALLKGSETVVERHVPMAGSRRSSALIEVVDSIFRDASLSSRQLQLVAVSIGPGSFTGLRIGITFAKTLAYALGCPVTGINSLHAAVESANVSLPQATTLHAVADAQRGELFHQTFCRNNEMKAEGAWMPSWLDATPREIITPSALAAKVGNRAVLVGSGIARHHEELMRVCSDVTLVACEPSAVSVGRLGAAQKPVNCDAWSLLPDYGRLSSAEEKREQACR